MKLEDITFHIVDNIKKKNEPDKGKYKISQQFLFLFTY